MRLFWLLIAAGLVLSPVVRAAELEAIPPELAQKIAKQLSEQAGKIEKPKFKLDPDTDKASGFHVPKTLGAIIVPQKDLKESEELAAKFKMDPGASLAYLFLFRLTPKVDGKQIDASQLHSVKGMTEDGDEFTVQVLLLAVRQLADDDYRLYAYGQGAKPLIDAKFAEGTGPGPVPTAVELKEVNESTRDGKIVVTVFGKFQATFPVGYTGG